MSRQAERFDDLYARHSPVAFQVAYLMTGDKAVAEDLTQEAFVRVLGRFGQLRKADSFRSYLLRTVTNLAKNHYRSRTKDGVVHESPATQREALETVHQRDELVGAMRRLPPRQRAAVVLRYCVDLTEQQTADALGTSVKAVKSLVRRGLTHLREQGEVTR